MKSKIVRNKILLKVLSFFLFYKKMDFVNININKFYKNEIFSKKQRKKIARDLFFSIHYYKIKKEEYFQYNFLKLSDYGRKEYIGNIERHEIYTKIGNAKTKNLLNDKYECYKKFEKYYNRNIIKVSEEKDYKNFENFYNNTKRIIIKPISASMGKNIEILEKGKIDTEKAWKKIVKNGECIIEEVIEQSKELGKFHNESINSIRIATFHKNNKADIIFAGIRMGCGNSVVDNAGSGGIFASIDVETGIVNSIGRTKDGKEFIYHPDSNVKIIGYEIPKWEELCNIVKETAGLIKEHQLIGWDFALSKNGWTMVEANAESEFGIRQICLGGLRKDVQKYINR